MILGENVETREPRFKLHPFGEITPKTDRPFLVQNIIPRTGLVVVWGPPKCGKSFWVFDLVMHIALGWEYRGRRVHQGDVVYVSCEGHYGFPSRVEAFRQKFLQEDHSSIPFWLISSEINLSAEHQDLVGAIRATLGTNHPAAVVIDTLNRSLFGSENEDRDMAAYVRAAEAIRSAFACAVIIVHHCGVEGTRPRGHSSLTGAVDAQLAVKRDASDNVVVTVERMKDGPEGDVICSRLEATEIGADVDGETITSCVIAPVDRQRQSTSHEPRLTKNQQTMYSILQEAGNGGLSAEQWNERLRDVGIGVKRKADIYDCRASLHAKGLIREFNGRWTASAA